MTGRVPFEPTMLNRRQITLCVARAISENTDAMLAVAGYTETLAFLNALLASVQRDAGAVVPIKPKPAKRPTHRGSPVTQ